MNEKALYHLSYVSTACDCLKFEDIQKILEQSNEHNPESGITGILVYCNKHFFQIIEGEKDAIHELYEKIAIDCRHDAVIKIQEGPISQRQFGNWSMAFKSYNKELKHLDHFNNEQFYSYITKLLEQSSNDGCNDVSLKVLADFFDLNG